jgi:hypothetical protein
VGEEIVAFVIGIFLCCGNTGSGSVMASGRECSRAEIACQGVVCYVRESSIQSWTYHDAKPSQR